MDTAYSGEATRGAQWQAVFEELRVTQRQLVDLQARRESFDVIFIVRQYRDELQRRLEGLTSRDSLARTLEADARQCRRRARELVAEAARKEALAAQLCPAA